MTNLEDITVTDEKGNKTYIPEIETARRAPAVVCAVASRTKRLRDKISKLYKDQELMSPDQNGVKKLTFSLKDVEILLANYIARLPFESEFLSGDIAKVDQAITDFEI